jgi:hypothetical protein
MNNILMIYLLIYLWIINDLYNLLMNYYDGDGLIAGNTNKIKKGWIETVFEFIFSLNYYMSWVVNAALV